MPDLVTKNVLISLVSEQRAPNIFIILDKQFNEISEYIFVSTPLMEKIGVVNNIKKATRIRNEVIKTIIVSEDSWTSVFEGFEPLNLTKEGTHYFVNLTGGTKMMSIGLFNYFTQPAYRHCSSIFYIPIGKNAFLQVFPEEQAREQPLTYRISLEEYLASYGIAATVQKGLRDLHRPESYTASVMPHFLSVMDSHAFWSAMKKLRDTYNRSYQKPALEAPVERGLQPFLEQIRYPLSARGLLTKGDIAYLTGGWFEEWAFSRLRQQLDLPGEAIRFGVRVERQNADGQAVPNECDILFTLNNTLHIVECKTGLGARPRQLFEDALYKLTALRNEFGQRVKALFFTLSDLRRQPRQWEETYLSRARLHRALLFDRRGAVVELEERLGKMKEGAAD